MSVARDLCSLTSLFEVLRGNNMSDSEAPHCVNRTRPGISASLCKISVCYFFKYIREKCVFLVSHETSCLFK